jgi:hypothetical protein
MAHVTAVMTRTNQVLTKLLFFTPNCPPAKADGHSQYQETARLLWKPNAH